MTNEFQPEPDDPQYIHLGKLLIETTSDPLTDWLTKMVIVKAFPQDVAHAAAIVFATQLSLIGDSLTYSTHHAKQVFAQSICKQIYLHMMSLVDIDHVPTAPKEPNESLN